MDIYVFSSTLVTDIWAGIGAGLWAISSKTAERPDIKTKAAKMVAGSLGVFYLSKPHYALTTPSLGSPRSVLKREAFLSMLPSLKGHESNWDDILMISATKSFVPAGLTKQDWDIVIKQLGS